MKKRLISLAFTLSVTLSCIISAQALPLPAEYEYGLLRGLCADGSGILAVDSYNKVIWRIEGDAITRAAGQIGVHGMDNEPIGNYADGTADTAMFMEPYAIAPFLDGYAISDAAANVIRYYDRQAIRTAAGQREAGNRDGFGTYAMFHHPTGLAAGPDGVLYIADTGNGCIRALSKNGEVTTLYRGLNDPTGLCYINGALYIAETGADRIVKLVNGSLSVVVGGQAGYVDGPAQNSRLRAPRAVTVDKDGTIYIADTGNGAVRCLKNGRMITLSADENTPAPPVMPHDFLLQNDSLLITDALAASLLSLSTLPPVYNDVSEDSVYQPYIVAATERKLTTGTLENTFSPDMPVTRAQFVTMLARMHRSTNGDDVIRGDAAFSDVPDGQWYSDAVNWAARVALAKGSDGYFAPARSISRQELVTLLYRYAQQNGYVVAAPDSLERFADADSIETYAQEAMAWGVSVGVLSGNPQGELMPAASATRAQTVKMLVSFMDSVGI